MEVSVLSFQGLGVSGLSLGSRVLGFLGVFAFRGSALRFKVFLGLSLQGLANLASGALGWAPVSLKMPIDKRSPFWFRVLVV